MPHCGNCGREVVDGADTCPDCGKRIGSNTSSIEEDWSKEHFGGGLLPIISAILMTFGSLILLQLAAITLFGGGCYFSITFFWLFLLCLGGAISASIRRFYPFALSAGVSMLATGIILSLMFPYALVGHFFLAALLGLITTVFLVLSRNHYYPKAQEESGDSRRPSRRGLRSKTIQKAFALVVVAMLIIVIPLSYQSCLYVNAREGYYEVRVSMASAVDFELVVPVPVNESFELWDLVNHLAIKDGNASWEIVETSQGLGLRIKGRGNITLRCEESPEANPYDFLSPQNRSMDDWDGSHPPFLVYVDASGLEHILGINVSAGYSSRSMHIWTYLRSGPDSLRAGWQVIEGRQSMGVA